MPARHFADNEATISVGLRVTGAQNSYLAVPVSLIRDSRRSGASRRTRSVALAVIFYLAMPPAGIAAQVPTTALAEFLPPPSFGVSRLDDTGLRDLSFLQQYFSYAGDSQRSSVNQLTLQPFVTKLLPDAWYVQTQPIITLDFVKNTSSVPVNLVVGKLFAGRWNVSLQATGYPPWTSPPSKQYELRVSIGYQSSAFFPKP